MQPYLNLEQPKSKLPPPKFILVIIIAIIIVTIIFMGIAGAGEIVGVASWYSYKSCRKEGTNGIYTASGEKFNENANTAAMWNVPFGTLVKVTNIANGLSVTIKITDKGPNKKLVKKGRIIDLSKAAFQKICPLKQGICKVKIEY